MKILGVSLSHDSGVAVVEGGRLTHAISEERFSRVKGDVGFPGRSLKWVTEDLGIPLETFDGIAIAGLVHGDPPNVLSNPSGIPMSPLMKTALKFTSVTHLDRLLFGTEKGCETYRNLTQNGVKPGKPLDQLYHWISERGYKGPVKKFEHHTCHQMSAVFTSGWDRCLALTIDGFGDALSGRVSLYENGKLRPLDATPIYHSIGTYYTFATALCGFPKIYHCGKVTGLAAYTSSENKAYEYFRKKIVFEPKSGKMINKGRFLYEQFAEMKKALAGCRPEEIAAAVQRVAEEVIVPHIAYWMDVSGERRLALAGGVFANVKLNQRICAIPGLEALFIHPHMGDGGLPAGAAFCLTQELAGEQFKPYRLENVFLGTPIDERGLEDRISKYGFRFQRHSRINLRAAELLAEGKVVARVSGAMEYGPRALGNRSILYQATDPTVNDWLNKKLRRTEFMPFAPMILSEDATFMLKGFDGRSDYAAEFMTITYDVTDACRKESPAVVHIDGTARPQVLKRDRHQDCYEIVHEYKRLSGLRSVINTSYNMHDEPIVHDENDALRAFQLSELDVLILNDYEVFK